MSVVYVLTTLILDDGGNDPTVEQVKKKAKQDNDDYVCRGLILIGLMTTRVTVNIMITQGLILTRRLNLLVGNMAKLVILKGIAKDDDVAWWVDSKAAVHVCKDRCWFETYESLNDGSILHMGNEPTALVHRRDYVDLRLNIDNDNIGSAFMSTSKLNDSILWHARLGYVHFKRMQDMSKDGLIPAFDMGTEKWNKKYFVTFIDDASRVPNKRNKNTPYELWTKKKPNLNYVWGCRVVVRLPDPKLKTLGKKGIECMFVGYDEHCKAFSIYVIEPNESVSINSIIESRHAIFDENIFFSVPRPNLKIPNRTKDIGGSVVPKEVTEEEQGMRSLTNTPIALMKSEDVAFWKKAINDEMDSIMGNNT
nr:zinc finger, CCHC-type [Tanacetum cinerariifolium]